MVFYSVLPMKWTTFSIDLMVLLFHVQIIVLNTNKYIYTRGTCATRQSVYDIFSVFPPVSANLKILIRFFVAAKML